LIGEAIESLGVDVGTNVEVARASNVSMGISVGVENVEDGVSVTDEGGGVLVVWLGKLQAGVTMTHNKRTIQKR